MKPGTLFRHARLLDPDWKPGPGERYSDAPRAICRVTAVRRGRIYYRQGTDPGRGTHYFRTEDTDSHIAELVRP